MRAFANEVDWRVLASVARGPKAVHRITSELPVERCTVSNSLTKLGKYGLVRYDRRKTAHVYHLNPLLVTVTSDGVLLIHFETEDGACLTVRRPLASARHEPLPELDPPREPPMRPGRTSPDGASRAADVDQGDPRRHRTRTGPQGRRS